MTQPTNKKSRGNLYASARRGQRGRISAKQIRLRQRCLEALERRLAGQTYQVIAREMRCKPEVASKFVLMAMRDMNVVPKERVEDVLAIELQRLDRMQAAVAKDAEKGDPGAIKLALRLMTMRARYLSLHPLPPTHSAALQINFPATRDQIVGVPTNPNDPRYYEPPLIEAKPAAPAEPIRWYKWQSPASKCNLLDETVLTGWDRFTPVQT